MTGNNLSQDNYPYSLHIKKKYLPPKPRSCTKKRSYITKTSYPLTSELPSPPAPGLPAVARPLPLWRIDSALPPTHTAYLSSDFQNNTAGKVIYCKRFCNPLPQHDNFIYNVCGMGWNVSPKRYVQVLISADWEITGSGVIADEISSDELVPE